MNARAVSTRHSPGCSRQRYPLPRAAFADQRCRINCRAGIESSAAPEIGKPCPEVSPRSATGPPRVIGCGFYRPGFSLEEHRTSCGTRYARGRDRREVKLNTAPKIMAAMPPMIIHIDLSVGLSVNARETSELNESAALMPKMRRMIPAANKAKPNALFIIIISSSPSEAQACAFCPAWENDPAFG
jgi:hypothetical protein